MSSTDISHTLENIAVIGLAGRFPGASNLGQFWENLRDGVEGISFFTDEELLAAGVDAITLQASNYVKAGAMLEGVELFDANFFGFHPREAEKTDPQHRLFLECAWEALENAGYDAGQAAERIGVYAGANMSSYLLSNLRTDRGLAKLADDIELLLGNDKDYLATRVSYKLNLKGPSININTACSTSLVATCLACQGLLNYQCDIALAGGVAVGIPQKTGYFYKDVGGGLSPDGHCRAFDAKAKGTIFGSGVGVIVLKRLSEARADGDTIHAVIKGFAINNDGSSKIGYLAPSVDGHTEVVLEALAASGVAPETISYIEAHGTGTAIGDPIEVAALTRAFRSHTDRKGFCAIGSVKTNIGHLMAAAGIASLIKTILALKHRAIPSNLHFERPNPKIDFANSPFFVNNKLSPWQTNGTPRRAGISALGVGGTNAHIILEEAPECVPSGDSRPSQLLVLSARSERALENVTNNLNEHIRQYPETSLPDIAYTLQLGRKAFSERRIVVCHDLEEGARALETRDPRRVYTAHAVPEKRPVVFMFSGAEAPSHSFGRQLYKSEPIFREQVDVCAEILAPYLGVDLRKLLYAEEVQDAEIAKQISQPRIGLPGLFVNEYALARVWMAWGVQPDALIGHSLGEYVAACVAGVVSLEDALAMVAVRSRLFERLPRGAMATIWQSEEELKPLLKDGLSLASVNGPSMCVVSGPEDAVDHLLQQLLERDVLCVRTLIAGAGHSEMVSTLVEEFSDFTRSLTFRAPDIPFISTVTGAWMGVDEAKDPGHWVRHMRQTVRFGDGLSELLKEPQRIFLEIGPEQTLSVLVRRHPARGDGHIAVSSLYPSYGQKSEAATLTYSLGKLWLAGAKLDWQRWHAPGRRLRIPLPTYPFEREHYWIQPQKISEIDQTKHRQLHKKREIADWFYVPAWRRTAPPLRRVIQKLPQDKLCWLIFLDDSGIGRRAAVTLESAGQEVVTVERGSGFERLGEKVYSISPEQREDYDELLRDLHGRNKLPHKILHLWNVTESVGSTAAIEPADSADQESFYSLLFLIQCLGRQELSHALYIGVVSNNMQAVTGTEELFAGKALALGLCQVTTREYLNITCRSIDISIPSTAGWKESRLAAQLIGEALAETADVEIAYRDGFRWKRTYEPYPLESSEGTETRLRRGGVYLITGGLGRLGPELAEYLARSWKAKLVLVGRSTFPKADDWEEWLATHDEHESISRRIQRVRALEALGAEVMIASADVSDAGRMQAVVALARERFGALNGVFHFAAVIDRDVFRTIGESTREHCRRVFRPKVEGLVALEQSLHGSEIDFCIMASSLASIMGGMGNCAYAAANHFVDAYAHRQCQISPVPWISVNWDAWRIAGTAGIYGPTGPTITSLEAILADLPMEPDEGIEALHRIISGATTAQVVVSTGDLEARLNQIVESESSKRFTPRSLHGRPNLFNAYVAPRTEIEKVVAEVWQKLLGVEQVGVYDNFFELGGDSLLAIRLVPQLNTLFQVEIPLRRLIEESNVAGVSETIVDLMAGRLSNQTTTNLVELNPHSIEPSADELCLLCVPYAGGNAIIYQAMAAALSNNYHVYSLNLPSNDFGGDDPPFQSLEEVAQSCAAEIRTRINGRIALYGHCGGSLLAVEIARLIEKTGREVETVYVGAALPLLPKQLAKLPPAEYFKTLPDADLYAFLTGLGGIDGSIPKEGIKLVLDGFRHDAITTWEYYNRLSDVGQPEKIAAPIVCIIGNEDPLVENYQERYKDWELFSSGATLAVIEGGGHYFIKRQASEVAEIIMQR
jgi:acyl transferase domain-containing protein/surfactin synthase thioesterase subunit/acyl carrier protein